MSAFRATAFSAFVLSFLVVCPSQAAETVVAEESCNLEGFSRPLRQTIVVLDQMAVEAWTAGDMSEKNRRWINAVVSLAGVQEAQRNGNAAPRERITVLLARANGSDLVRIFTGCPPTFSRDELERLVAQTTGFSRKFEEWLGKDPRSRVEAEQKAFRTKLLAALVQLTKENSTKISESKFYSLLPDIGRSFELGGGIPRVVIFSPLTLSDSSFSDKKLARQTGFQEASRSGADLKRAEVYIVRGRNADPNSFARDYIAALLLGSKGHLVDTSGETLPALHEPPQSISIYGGFISYGLVKAPMQIRMAVDSSGALVNSWVEISVDKAVATPLTGKAICKGVSLDNCEVKGDGKDFSQLWASEGDPSKPIFDQKLPFSGIRWFEFTSDTKGVHGRFFDPMVIINKQPDMPFDLSTTAHVKF